MRKAGGARPRPKLIWSDRALENLEAIGDFISADDPEAAELWVERLKEKARSITVFPMRGRRVPEVGLDTVREILLRNYRIIHRVGDGSVEIVTILEGHRLLAIDRGER